MQTNYLTWLCQSTPTKWWHDSAIPSEIDDAIALGASGVTTNPVLTYKSFCAAKDFWEPEVSALSQSLGFQERAEALLKLVANHAAQKFDQVFEKTNQQQGFALGQLDPSKAGDAKYMIAQGRRISSWRKNIAIKLPATAAGLEVIETLASEGIAICATINCSVSQAVESAKAYERGRDIALKNGITPAIGLIVSQIGRIDDYLRDVAKDMNLYGNQVSENDIIHSGLAVAKRTYEIFQKQGYHCKIMPAGLRETHHVCLLAGADVVFSIHPRIQKMILQQNPPKEQKFQTPVNSDIIERLMLIDEFAKAYNIDGLEKKEFISFGVTQRLLSQFIETGWAPLETYGSENVSSRWT